MKDRGVGMGVREDLLNAIEKLRGDHFPDEPGRCVCHTPAEYDHAEKLGIIKDGRVVGGEAHGYRAIRLEKL